MAVYKVAQETEHLTRLQKEMEDSEWTVRENKAIEREFIGKKKKLKSDISFIESKKNIDKMLSEMDEREAKCVLQELDNKHQELKSVNEEIASAADKAKDAVILIGLRSL